jgi:hypothetical protein
MAESEERSGEGGGLRARKGVVREVVRGRAAAKRKGDVISRRLGTPRSHTRRSMTSKREGTKLITAH